jgi:hypothetical protein
MRIVENNPQLLVLRQRPPLGGLLAVGAMLLLMVNMLISHAQAVAFWSAAGFGAIGLSLLRTTTVTFDKTARTCSVDRFDLRGPRHTDFAFDEIVDVRIEPAPRARGIGAMSCRFSLVTADAVVPLNDGYEPGPERYRLMREDILEAVFAGRPRPDIAQAA